MSLATCWKMVFWINMHMCRGTPRKKNVLHSRLLVAQISQFQPLPQAISSSAPPRHTCSDTRVKRQTVARRQRNFQCNVRTHDPPTILIRKKHEDAEFAGTGRPLTFSNNSTHPATQNSHIVNSQNGELCNATAKLITNTSSYVTVLSCFFRSTMKQGNQHSTRNFFYSHRGRRQTLKLTTSEPCDT